MIAEGLANLSDRALGHLGALLLAPDPKGPRAFAPKFVDWLVSAVECEQGRRDSRPVAEAAVDLTHDEVVQASLLAVSLEGTFEQRMLAAVALEQGHRLSETDRQTARELSEFAGNLREVLVACATAPETMSH